METVLHKVNASPVPTRRRKVQAIDLDPYQEIRRLIWLYLILWLIEGGLRRWFLPSLATPLLLIRDPVALLIYWKALSKNLFPSNGFIVAGAILGFLTLASALLIGHGNPVVALYGVRCDFLHVPLIFVMARVLRQKDLIALSTVAVWLVIPYTILMVAQFYQPQDAWVNRGVAGSLDGAGFSGAEGHFRPPGAFSFTIGTSYLYPLFTACWFVLLLERKFPVWLMMASGVAILVAIPISISRSLFLGVVIVVLVGMAAMVLGGRLSIRLVFQLVLAAIILPVLAAQVPAFQDGMSAFTSRWQASTTDQGGFQATIVDRVLNDLFGSFANVGSTGLGTGFSTNVGQKILTQNVGFGASEAEWGRLMYDNGLYLGSVMVAYRVALAGLIVLASFQAWQRKSGLGLIFASAGLMNLLNGEWGQATTLGAAIIAGGLALAGANTMDDDEVAG